MFVNIAKLKIVFLLLKILFNYLKVLKNLLDFIVVL